MLYERWRTIARDHAREIALRDVGSQRAWTFRELSAAVESVPAPPASQRVVFPSGNTPEFILSVLQAWRFSQVICPLENGQTEPDLPLPPRDICLLKTTSATTGAARHVAFTAAELAADPANIVTSMGLRHDSPNLSLLSLAHSYGFSSLVLPLLLHGIPLVLAPGALPETLRQAAATGDNWTLPAVPALWRTWHEADAVPGNLRLAISAGAPLPLPLEMDIFERRGLKLHNFLGSTECGGIAYDATTTPRTDAALAGTALHHVELLVGATGCLEVRGNAVGNGYWPDPDARLEAGVFRTQDLVDIAQGRIFLRGRASDLINVAGRKLAPETVERALLTHAAVTDCLVLGLPSRDDARGDTIGAVVAGPPTLSAENLREFLQDRLPVWQIPREWHIVKTLPVNARGKLSRSEWRKHFRKPNNT